ncbi:hypothetical protein LFM09_17940 [Lentzea alba]|uniref:hypothetical protein n=1 Tax=Lentzea alba TaxID=2714351 RepID=UPI0039BEF712
MQRGLIMAQQEVLTYNWVGALAAVPLPDDRTLFDREPRYSRPLPAYQAYRQRMARNDLRLAIEKLA